MHSHIYLFILYMHFTDACMDALVRGVIISTRTKAFYQHQSHLLDLKDSYIQTVASYQGQNNLKGTYIQTIMSNKKNG